MPDLFVQHHGHKATSPLVQIQATIESRNSATPNRAACPPIATRRLNFGNSPPFPSNALRRTSYTIPSARTRGFERRTMPETSRLSITTPEAQELDSKRAELSQLETVIAEREWQLT